MQDRNKVFGKDKAPTYTGGGISDLDIRTGDDLSEVLEKIANAVVNNTSERSAVSTGEIYTTVNIQPTNESVKDCIRGIKSNFVQYSIVKQGDKNVFSWNMRDFIEQVDGVVEVVNVSIFDSNTSNRTIFDGSLRSSNVVIDRFPFNVDVKVRAMTPCGRIEFVASTMVTNTSNIQQTLPFEAKPMGTGNIKMSLNETFDYLMNEISNLKYQIKNK